MDPISQRLLLGSADVDTGGHWLVHLGDSSNLQFSTGVAIDGSRNVYAVGAMGDDLCLAKFNSAGELQWQRGSSYTSVNTAYGVAVDNAGNPCIVGELYTSNSSQEIFVIKFDASGNQLWAVQIGKPNSLTNDRGYGIAVDGAGNFYVTGHTSSEGAGGSDAYLAKISSSGLGLWQRRLGGTGNEWGYAVAVDGSGNVFMAGTNTSEASYNQALLAKYNSNGTLQWQRAFYQNGNAQNYFHGVAVDSAGNIYAAGRVGTATAFLAKYNTSGTLQWSRKFDNGSTGAEELRAVTVDGADNIYVVGGFVAAGGSYYDALIAKYNTSGTLQWQRALGGLDHDRGVGVVADRSGNIYIALETENRTSTVQMDLMIAKLPADGSKTGTYGRYTYEVSTVTEADAAGTSATRTLTSATATLTGSTLYMTVPTSTLTAYKQVV